MSTTNNSLSILSKSGSWIRGNPGRFACMLIVAVLYGLLLACIVQPDYEGFMAAALMINFLVPPVLLIINTAAACFRKSTWKFPLGCVAVSLPLLFALIHGFEGGPCREGRRLLPRLADGSFHGAAWSKSDTSCWYSPYSHSWDSPWCDSSSTSCGRIGSASGRRSPAGR